MTKQESERERTGCKGRTWWFETSATINVNRRLGIWRPYVYVSVPSESQSRSPFTNCLLHTVNADDDSGLLHSLDFFHLNMSSNSVNISLEDYLAESLRPLLAILPEHLAAELKDILNFTHAAQRIASHDSEPSERTMVRTIPYALLAAISKWARTPEAEYAMKGHEPPLRVQDYSMVALLAGTRTSPERKFPVVVTPITITQVSHSREVGDRRAVIAVVNAMLSIGGSGVATWWAAGRLLWREEWVRRAFGNPPCRGAQFMHCITASVFSVIGRCPCRGGGDCAVLDLGRPTKRARLPSRDASPWNTQSERGCSSTWRQEEEHRLFL